MGEVPLLERTLDDSANRRQILPSAFLAADEILRATHRVLRGLQIRDKAIRRNMQVYGLFAATERLLMELGGKGALIMTEDCDVGKAIGATVTHSPACHPQRPLNAAHGCLATRRSSSPVTGGSWVPL